MSNALKFTFSPEERKKSWDKALAEKKNADPNSKFQTSVWLAVTNIPDRPQNASENVNYQVDKLINDDVPSELEIVSITVWSHIRHAEGCWVWDFEIKVK